MIVIVQRLALLSYRKENRIQKQGKGEGGGGGQKN